MNDDIKKNYEQYRYFIVDYLNTLNMIFS